MDLEENGVYLSKSIEESENYIKQLFDDGKESVSLCPFYNIEKEYRCFYLNGDILLIYGKERPYRLTDSNKKVYLSWKHNLCGGAMPEIIEKGDLYNKLEEIAIKAAKAINITFATVDIIKTEDNKLYVIEINSGVCMSKFSERTENGYEIAKEIYRKALKLLFE